MKSEYQLIVILDEWIHPRFAGGIGRAKHKLWINGESHLFEIVAYRYYNIEIKYNIIAIIIDVEVKEGDKLEIELSPIPKDVNQPCLTPRESELVGGGARINAKPLLIHKDGKFVWFCREENSIRCLMSLDVLRPIDR